MNFFSTPHKLTVYRAYEIRTTAGRELRVLFKGHARSNRLWFVNLDAPYDDLFLKPRHLVEITPL